jgi:hypothetical protein
MHKREQVVQKVVEMFFLLDEDSLFGTHYLWRRYQCESNEIGDITLLDGNSS